MGGTLHKPMPLAYENVETKVEIMEFFEFHAHAVHERHSKLCEHIADVYSSIVHSCCHPLF